MGDIILLCVLFVIIFWFSADKSSLEINDTILSRILLLLIVFLIYNNINILFLFLILFLFIYFKGSPEFKQNLGGKIKNLINSSPKDIFINTINYVKSIFQSNSEIDTEDFTLNLKNYVKSYFGYNVENFKVNKETDTVPDKYVNNKEGEDNLLNMLKDFEINTSELEVATNNDQLSNHDMEMLNDLQKTNEELLESHEDFLHNVSYGKSAKMEKLKKNFDSFNSSLSHGS
jgi:hypothetical protein